MNNVDKIFQSSSSCDEYVDGYLKYLGEILTLIDRSEVVQFIQVLMDAREASSTVYFIGNGGSAATASHFANDISIGTRSFKKPFRTVSLCDNQAVITAIGNDNGYENIFYEQLAVLLKAGDVVVGISASGNSENIIRAMEYANQNDAITVGLTAFDGGKLREVSKYSVHIPTIKGEYGPAEDGHMIIDHVVGNYLMRVIKQG